MTLRSQTPAVLLFAGLALFPFAARFGAEAYLLALGARVLILALAALSLDFLVGQAALVSFGHAAYLGIGAYAVVLASMAGIDDLLVQALIAVAAAALFAALTGYVSLRASGVYYIMSTLAFGQMLYFLFVSLSALGGDDGYTLSSRSRALRRAAPDERLLLLLSLSRRARPRLSPADADRRFALRPRSQRDPAKSLARSGAWLSALPVSSSPPA